MVMVLDGDGDGQQGSRKGTKPAWLIGESSGQFGTSSDKTSSVLRASLAVHVHALPLALNA